MILWDPWGKILAKLRPAYRSGAIHSLLLPGACDPGALHLPRFSKFDVAHRGHYEVAGGHDSLAGVLREIAEEATGSHLDNGPLRFFRFRRGGYSLMYDDALTRIERGVEMTLDLSSGSGAPPAVYQRGTFKLTVPQVRGLVAIVERTADLYRYDRYLPASVGAACVVRLRASFPFAD